jgi:glycosyltransferase involved in cell wall biosynthesis
LRYLFVHQNFPGQFLHLVRRLAADPRHDVVFISEPNENNIPNVRRIHYRLPRAASAETHPNAREFDVVALRADIVAAMARQVKALGFTPDVILGHHGWGELLNLQDVFPNTPIIGYFEFYYNIDGADVRFDPEFPLDERVFPLLRARNATNLLALSNPGIGQTPTRFQFDTYPDWAQRKITLLREGVNLDVCKPDPMARRRPLALGDFRVAPSDKLVTYVARNLEPYRGYHSMMRAAVRILQQRRDVKIIMVGGDEVSYGAAHPKGSWREVMMAELGDQLDLGRVLFPGKVPYETYLRLLQRADVHVYLSYPFVASWSLRESLACGCALVGSDTETVTEFIQQGRTGLLADMRKPMDVADEVLRLLEDVPLARRLRAASRAWAERNLPMETYLDEYEALIDRAINGPVPVEKKRSRA